VKETLTDKNGEWLIRGPRGTRINIYKLLTFLTGTYYIEPPLFIIFKPGYCSWPQGFYIESCKNKIKFELNSEGYYKVGNAETIGLPMLKNREDRSRNLPTYIYDTGGSMNASEIIRNQKEYIRLLEEERKSLGLSGYKMELNNEK
jgi:hypothetical protein